MLCGLMLAFSIAAMPPPDHALPQLLAPQRIVSPQTFPLYFPNRISSPESAHAMLNGAFNDIAREVDRLGSLLNDFMFGTIEFVPQSKEPSTIVIFHGILITSPEPKKILICDRDAVTVNLANAVRSLQKLYANSDEFLTSGKIVMTRDEIRFEKEGDTNSVEEIDEQPAPNSPASGAP